MIILGYRDHTNISLDGSRRPWLGAGELPRPPKTAFCGSSGQLSGGMLTGTSSSEPPKDTPVTRSEPADTAAYVSDRRSKPARKSAMIVQFGLLVMVTAVSAQPRAVPLCVSSRAV